jgi:hypothetical protein
MEDQSRPLENVRRKHASSRSAQTQLAAGGGESTALILPEILAALRAHLR